MSHTYTADGCVKQIARAHAYLRHLEIRADVPVPKLLQSLRRNCAPLLEEIVLRHLARSTCGSRCSRVLYDRRRLYIARKVEYDIRGVPIAEIATGYATDVAFRRLYARPAIHDQMICHHM